MPTATQEKPAKAAAQETATPAAPPIQLKLTPKATHATFHGTQIDFTNKEVIVHTNDPIGVEPANEDAQATRGTLDIRRSDDFNSVATRGVAVIREKDNSLTISTDTKETKVRVQAVPTPPAP